MRNRCKCTFLRTNYFCIYLDQSIEFLKNQIEPILPSCQRIELSPGLYPLNKWKDAECLAKPSRRLQTKCFKEVRARLQSKCKQILRTTIWWHWSTNSDDDNGASDCPVIKIYLFRQIENRWIGSLGHVLSFLPTFYRQCELSSNWF